MKKTFVLLLIVFFAVSASKAFSATVTCVVEEVSGGTIILKNCDERAKGFERGNTVKVKLQKKGQK